MLELRLFTLARILAMLKLSKNKFYLWSNNANGTCYNSTCGNARSSFNNLFNNLPKSNRITPEEKNLVIDYVNNSIHQSIQERAGLFLRNGYRRIAYEIINKDIAFVSPASVYRILKAEGLLNRWNTSKTSSKGNGFKQPTEPHQQWHTDIKYIYENGFKFYFISVLDGFSRYILSHDIRASMSSYDVSIVIQKAKDLYPLANPRLISDNGKQFSSPALKKLLSNYQNIKQVKTSICYPQSNGKIERFHRTLNEEWFRTSSLLSLEDARESVNKYVEYYNNHRLHSALNYLTPADYLTGVYKEKLNARKSKLKNAKINRRQYWQQNGVINSTVKSETAGSKAVIVGGREKCSLISDSSFTNFNNFTKIESTLFQN